MCGYPHPDIMIRETGLTKKQLEETMLYLDLFPVGEKRMDARFSILCSLVSAAFGGHKIDIDFDAETYVPVRSKEEAGEYLFKQLCALFGVKNG